MYRSTPITARSISLLTILLTAIVAGVMPVLSVEAAGPPATYAVDFVSTAAFGSAMNDAGDVAGTSYPDTGCGSTCLPPLETVVWRGGVRIVLPTLAGFYPISTVRGINNAGWAAGEIGYPGISTHAVVWKPVSGGYEAVDLGVLPGTTISTAAGIDNLGRVVGYSTTGNFPPSGAPFIWTEADGMVDLAGLGFPNETPLAVSPGGTVATPGYWYRLGDPTRVTALAPPPTGFSGPGNYPAAINDAGDQVRFQISTGTQFFPYLFRYRNAGTWQQIWFNPAGNLAPFGVGSTTSAGDITGTVSGVGLVAYGPDGLAEPLAGKLSPAYGGSDVPTGGPINSSGQILARVMIGQSQRLVRLVPAAACTSGCIRVASIQMVGKFINDPANPGQCTSAASNRVSATITVTDELGSPIRGITIAGRFLDDYWTNTPVSGTTNRRGSVRFNSSGPACVGAVAFLVDNATGSGRMLDRTTGTLTNYVIPAP